MVVSSCSQIKINHVDCHFFLGSITTDKNAPFKSESTSDLDLVPKVIQEDISDDKGHQRSFSLGETKKMAKQCMW